MNYYIHPGKLNDESFDLVKQIELNWIYNNVL